MFVLKANVNWFAEFVKKRVGKLDCNSPRGESWTNKQYQALEFWRSIYPAAVTLLTYVFVCVGTRSLHPLPIRLWKGKRQKKPEIHLWQRSCSRKPRGACDVDPSSRERYSCLGFAQNCAQGMQEIDHPLRAPMGKGLSSFPLYWSPSKVNKNAFLQNISSDWLYEKTSMCFLSRSTFGGQVLLLIKS